MATILKAHKPAPKGERLTFVGWLQEEFRDRNCMDGERYDVPKFARQYGFAPITVRNWLSGYRRPSMEMCGVLADNLDLLVLEVVCAAGHLHWSDIDEYSHAYEDAENWATTGDL